MRVLGFNIKPPFNAGTAVKMSVRQAANFSTNIQLFLVNVAFGNFSILVVRSFVSRAKQLVKISARFSKKASCLV